jgi:hypothetical protein
MRATHIAAQLTRHSTSDCRRRVLQGDTLGKTYTPCVVDRIGRERFVTTRRLALDVDFAFVICRSMRINSVRDERHLA